MEYNSEFLEDAVVAVVFNDDPQYPQVKPFFEEYGFGFMVPDKNLIIIDGEILIGKSNAKDILKFIEAHEVAHILFGHDGPRNDQHELEADLGAYHLLKEKNYTNSMELLLEHFENRHNVKFNEEMLDDIFTINN
jgi:hypothetical protein